ncbi:MAG: NPCBM/NEW2 domain-containing protein [Kiritimatiellaeota bacterium]|nr:NPCBM/NEW2 domain-containing protein [Kiritimatiellota bacterium]
MKKLVLMAVFVAAASMVMAAPKPVSRDEVAKWCDAAALRYVSPILTTAVEGNMLEVEADVKGAEYVTFIITDGGDGYGCDHTDLLEPRFIGSWGEKKLTALDWEHQQCGWNSTSKNRSVGGGKLTVLGKVYEDGIGTHSPGLLMYEVPQGAEKFKARVALDDSGTKQNNPAPSSVQFIVYAGIAPPSLVEPFRLAKVPNPAIQREMLAVFAGADVSKETKNKYALLTRELTEKPRAHGGVYDEATRASQAFNAQANIWASDRDPLDIMARRVRALHDDLADKAKLSAFKARLEKLESGAKQLPVEDMKARAALFCEGDALLREIALKNPLLAKIPSLVFVTREALPPDEYGAGNHMCDQFFGFHATLHGKTIGNGLYVLEKPWSDKPVARNLLADSVIEAGARKGQKLGNGGYLAPEVSFDGKEILFCYTDGEPKIRVWNEQTTFHIFRCNADGSKLVQLTDGSVNDLFPCCLPNGRVAFISERRGGFGRCHGRPVPSFTLHTMFEDGTDITRLSPHETNEWFPSVDNNGMIVYTRWDYVDRGFNQAHHAWITYPDGRDSRAINGNTHVSERTAPHQEMNVRAIPGSSKYLALAAGHHTEARGSVLMIDPTVPDDDAMSQVKRVTPDQLFPEAEFYHDRASGAYASPYPLSENYYLCVYDGFGNNQYGPMDNAKRRYAITLLDAFGNKVHIYTHPDISCLSPVPLTARPKPPVIAHGTLVGRPRQPNGDKPKPIPEAELPKMAKVGLVNVYETRRPFPEGTKIKALRIWQVLPKVTPNANDPRIGYGDQKGAKLVMGTVPVEEDGSAYWEQPVNVPILFHALDENGCAVQGMRSVTYVAPGETLMCNGCHDQRVGSVRPPPAATAMAMKRAPSKIAPEMEGTNPFHFARLVQPVLESKCVGCHGDKRKDKMPDLRRGDFEKDRNFMFTSFNSLRPYVKYFDGAGWTEPYTVPGKFGALASKVYPMLAKGHNDVELTPAELRRLAIWLDSNGLFHGHDLHLKEQSLGQIIPPDME